MFHLVFSTPQSYVCLPLYQLVEGYVSHYSTWIYTIKLDLYIESIAYSYTLRINGSPAFQNTLGLLSGQIFATLGGSELQLRTFQGFSALK
jgi:hypothetical protein